MKTFFTIIFVLTITVYYGQDKAYKDKDILGLWTGTKKATKNGRDTLNNGKKMKNMMIIKFSSDNSVIYPDSPPEYYKDLKFSIDDNKLMIGIGCYFIEKLTKDELVLLELDNKTCKDNPLGFRLWFTKTIK